jgi:eukaryotic-like serine/threonine-protein kinase
MQSQVDRVTCTHAAIANSELAPAEVAVKRTLEAQWSELSPHLAELLALEPAARQGWLHDLAQRRPELAAQLDSCLHDLAGLDARNFLDSPSAWIPGSTTLAGEHIGAYTLDRLIGHGGMGTVWRAHRHDGRFEGEVAVKLLNAALIGHPAERRFVREGSVLAKLQHLNIARLMDAGVAAHGQPYLVLELVDGMRIDHYCDARRLTIEQRLVLFDNVLAAVAHAHNHLVIHSDIKPSNILVTTQGVVKLLDFGIAKLLRDDTEDITVIGYRALTPEYASPEQLQGGAITTASDVYSLGVLLYQLLCGRHPGTNSAAISAPAAHQVPPRLSNALAATPTLGDTNPQQVAADRHTTLPRLRRQLQGDLENIVARALQQRAADRYPTIAALADDLQRHLTHLPVQARPESSIYRCAKFMRRYRGAVAAAALVLLAVTIGLTGTLIQARRAEAAAASAQRERDNAIRERVHSDSKSELFNFLIAESAGKALTPAALLARGETMVQKQFVSDPDVRARLNFSLASLYAQAGLNDRAMVLTLQAQSTLRHVDDTLQSDVDCTLANRQRAAGSNELAGPLLDNAIARLGTAPAVDDPTILPYCLLERSALHTAKGDFKAALADTQHALEVLGIPQPHQRMLAVRAHASLGDVKANLGNIAGGIQAYRAAFKELELMGRDKSAAAPWLLGMVGSLLFNAGQVLAAQQAYETALAVERSLGHPRNWMYNEGRYGRVLLEMGRAADAKTLHSRARRAAQADGIGYYAALFLLYRAVAQCASTDLLECDRSLDAARSEMLETFPTGHARLGALEAAYAQQAFTRGQWSTARDTLQRAMAIYDGAQERSPLSIKALVLLARAELQLRNPGAAQLHATRAVADARTLMQGFDHSAWLGEALVAQGLVQQAQGELSLAQASWRAALTQLQSTLGSTAPATAAARELLDSRHLEVSTPRPR